MGRKKNLRVWRHFTEKDDKSNECNFCKQVYKFKNVNKFENHLIGCLHCPEAVKSQMKSNVMNQTRGSQDDESDSSRHMTQSHQHHDHQHHDQEHQPYQVSLDRIHGRCFSIV